MHGFVQQFLYPSLSPPLAFNHPQIYRPQISVIKPDKTNFFILNNRLLSETM
jgi:hypothetical protein